MMRGAEGALLLSSEMSGASESLTAAIWAPTSRLVEIARRWVLPVSFRATERTRDRVTWPNGSVLLLVVGLGPEGLRGLRLDRLVIFDPVYQLDPREVMFVKQVVVKPEGRVDEWL